MKKILVVGSIGIGRTTCSTTAIELALKETKQLPSAQMQQKQEEPAVQNEPFLIKNYQETINAISVNPPKAKTKSHVRPYKYHP